MNMCASKSTCSYITYINAYYCYVCRHTEVRAADWAIWVLSGLVHAFALLRPMCPSAKHDSHFTPHSSLTWSGGFLSQRLCLSYFLLHPPKHMMHFVDQHTNG